MPLINSADNRSVPATMRGQNASINVLSDDQHMPDRRGGSDKERRAHKHETVKWPGQRHKSPQNPT